MPRYARLHYPGGIFHIVARCLNREFLIEGGEERARYLQLLESSLGRCDATLLAYCLMSNHVHLVVRAGSHPLEKLMKPLHTGYAVWKNKRSGRLGPVFAGRYKSPLVDEETYLLELIRYVHNNPVRAHVVGRADQSPWSSHRAYVGQEKAPPWLNIGEVLGRFSDSPIDARRGFADFVDDGVDEARRPELSGERPERIGRTLSRGVGDAWRASVPVVGPEAFAEKVFGDLQAREQAAVSEPEGTRRRPELEELIAYTCSVMDLQDWEFDQHAKRRGPRLARLVITWLWVRMFGGTQAEIARALKTYSSRVSTWYGLAVRELPALEPLIDEVLTSLPDASVLSSWKVTNRIHYHLATDEELSAKSLPNPPER